MGVLHREKAGNRELLAVNNARPLGGNKSPSLTVCNLLIKDKIACWKLFALKGKSQVETV